MGLLVDCERTVLESIDGLGGLDIIVSNAVGFPYDNFGIGRSRALEIEMFILSNRETGLDQIHSIR